MPVDLKLTACNLDPHGVRRQRERYGSLERHVEGLARSEGALTARFDQDVDAQLVDETIAVERECCPFFTLAYDAGTRELAITVGDARQEPALDVLQSALGGTPELRLRHRDSLAGA